MRASVNPIVKTMMNKNRTYFGALDVIAKILLGSKCLNIINLYILKKDNLIFIMEKYSNQECRRGNVLRVLFNTLDQNMTEDSLNLCQSFEGIVLKKRIN